MIEPPSFFRDLVFRDCGWLFRREAFKVLDRLGVVDAIPSRSTAIFGRNTVFPSCVLILNFKEVDHEPAKSFDERSACPT